MTSREGMSSGGFSECDLPPDRLYERIKGSFVKNKTSFLPSIYDKEAVEITLEKFIKHMPFYVTGDLAFRLTITRGEEVYLNRVFSLSKTLSPQAVARMFWFFDRVAGERKVSCYGSSYDRVIPLYAEVSTRVEEGYELAVVSPDLVQKTRSLPFPSETFFLPYFPDYYPHVLSVNEFMACFDLETAGELAEELLLYALEIRGAVGVFSRKAYPLLILKKRIEGLGMKTELRRVFEYRGRLDTKKGRKLVRKGEKIDLPIYLLLENKLIKV